MKLKTAKIMAYLATTPDAKVSAVAAKFKVSAPYIYALRKKVTPVVPALLPVPEAPEPDKVDAVLDSRAMEYGTFAKGASLMQAIKRTMAAHAQEHGKTFADDQWEALEMIVHKMARIVNGNPNNPDSWLDIAGYAMLVADRLDGRAR